MKRKVLMLFMLFLTMLLAPALAADVETSQEEGLLLIETDRSRYMLGEEVTITITNVGSVYAGIGGWPCVIINTYPESEPVWPRYFALLAWGLEPGESETWIWNQCNVYADENAEPGTYVVNFIGALYTPATILEAFFEIVEEWDVVLTASLAGYYDVSDFGVRRDATEGFDAAYDMIDPPSPITGVVSYFRYPENPLLFQKLSVSKIPLSTYMTWPYTVEARGIEGVLCISWDPEEIAVIPPEYDVLLCTPEGCIDMRQVTQYCFHSDELTRYPCEIKVVMRCDFELQLHSGWNMISFPCLPEDRSFSNIFSDRGFYQVLTWDGSGYVDVSTENVEAGWGYWVLVLEDCTVTITDGGPVANYGRDLPAGWSMIGSIFPCTVDAECVFPEYYQLLTWDGTGYVTSTIIEPGKGYWVLVLEPTRIIIDDSCCLPS